MRAKLPQLRQALDGRVRDHHRLLITQILAHIEFIERSLHTLEQEIEERLRPFEEAVALLRSIPVLQETAIRTIVSELGVDMERFPSDKHLASWAGVCPGNYESAGKRRSGKTTQGNVYLRAVLCEVAWVIAYTEAQLSIGLLSPCGPSTRQETGDPGGCTQTADHYLSCIED